MSLIKRLWTEESGQGMTEYAMILGFIALIVVVGVTAFGEQLLLWFNGLTGQLPPTP